MRDACEELDPSLARLLCVCNACTEGIWHEINCACCTPSSTSPVPAVIESAACLQDGNAAREAGHGHALIKLVALIDLLRVLDCTPALGSTLEASISLASQQASCSTPTSL